MRHTGSTSEVNGGKQDQDCRCCDRCLAGLDCRPAKHRSGGYQTALPYRHDAAGGIAFRDDDRGLCTWRTLHLMANTREAQGGEVTISCSASVIPRSVPFLESSSLDETRPILRFASVEGGPKRRRGSRVAAVEFGGALWRSVAIREAGAVVPILTGRESPRRPDFGGPRGFFRELSYTNCRPGARRRCAGRSKSPPGNTSANDSKRS